MRIAKRICDFGIVVHGGAGSFYSGSRIELMNRKKKLLQSASEGFTLLKKKGSSIEAIEHSIRVLEDSGIFNAGRGASLSVEGTATADSAIMLGNLECGAVGSVSIVKNPISLARKVMEKSDHVLLVGDKDVSKFCLAVGERLESLKPSKKNLRLYAENISKMQNGLVKAWPRNSKLLGLYLGGKQESGKEILANESSDTVGAVAIDSEGKLCAGVSTGGRWLKLPGRVGDSAIVGAGLYADEDSGAACATGAGEEIIRVALSKSVCDLMRAGADAQAACDCAINMLTNRRGFGTAGVIAVDRFGRFGCARNTEMLQRAFRFESVRRTVVAILPHEKDPVQRSAAKDGTRLNF